jgi:hypothetical protein
MVDMSGKRPDVKWRDTYTPEPNFLPTLLAKAIVPFIDALSLVPSQRLGTGNYHAVTVDEELRSKLRSGH